MKMTKLEMQSLLNESLHLLLMIQKLLSNLVDALPDEKKPEELPNEKKLEETK